MNANGTRWARMPRAVFTFLGFVLLALLIGWMAQEAAKLAKKYNAVPEYRLEDGTRVDLLSPTHAWEVDWAKNGKWAEAIGQTLYYAIQTNRQPGVILLVRDPEKDKPYVERCRKVCDHLWIDLRVEQVK